MVDGMDAITRSANRSLRPFLIALVAAVLLNMALRLRILEHVLRAHRIDTWLLGVIQRGLMVVFAALLVAFCWLLLVRVLPEFRRGLAPSRRQLASLVWLASGMAANNLLSENIAI